MSKGGIYTAGGNKIPPRPNVTGEVEKWSKLIQDLRSMHYKPDQIRAMVEIDQAQRADKIAHGTTEGCDALVGD